MVLLENVFTDYIWFVFLHLFHYTVHMWSFQGALGWVAIVGGGGFRPGSKNQDQKNDRFFLGSEAKLSHLRHKSQNIKQ